MAKARPIDVIVDSTDNQRLVDIEAILRQEHGAHGLRLLGRTVLDDLSTGTDPVMFIEDGGDASLSFRYSTSEGIVATSSSEEPIDRILSKFAINNLRIPVDQQSSREDYLLLSDYVGDQPRLEADPSLWITQNPLISELCRRYPQYGNLIRYICNERGLFLKVGNYPNQRAYWNSATNGGLPVYKKADPTHEGTFMLHDIFHFVPKDPVIGSHEIQPADKSAYIAHRLMSEAITLVLADMVAVADANLEEKGYDISRRKIYPVYKSILQTSGPPELDKLLAANVYFCFTGSGDGFEALGASREVVEAYRSKYESVFKDDFLWNLHNFDEMLAERESNPLIREYYQWLEDQTEVPSIAIYKDISNVNGQGLDIAAMLSRFRASFSEALLYNQPINDLERHKLATEKYLAGQRVVFARFGRSLDPSGHIAQFDALFDSLHVTSSTNEIAHLHEAASHVVDDYIEQLGNHQLMLPHEQALYRFSAPLYPIKFVNYERKQEGASLHLADEMNSFLAVNQKQLSRVLEAATAP